MDGSLRVESLCLDNNYFRFEKITVWTKSADCFFYLLYTYGRGGIGYFFTWIPGVFSTKYSTIGIKVLNGPSRVPIFCRFWKPKRLKSENGCFLTCYGGEFLKILYQYKWNQSVKWTFGGTKVLSFFEDRNDWKVKGFLNIFGVECLKEVSILSELIQYRTFYHCPELTKHSVWFQLYCLLSIH